MGKIAMLAGFWISFLKKPRLASIYVLTNQTKGM